MHRLPIALPVSLTGSPSRLLALGAISLGLVLLTPANAWAHKERGQSKGTKEAAEDGEHAHLSAEDIRSALSGDPDNTESGDAKGGDAEGGDADHLVEGSTPDDQKRGPEGKSTADGTDSGEAAAAELGTEEPGAHELTTEELTAEPRDDELGADELSADDLTSDPGAEGEELEEISTLGPDGANEDAPSTFLTWAGWAGLGLGGLTAVAGAVAMTVPGMDLTWPGIGLFGVAALITVASAGAMALDAFYLAPAMNQPDLDDGAAGAPADGETDAETEPTPPALTGLFE